MQLTSEQEAIIQSDENIKINAVAGSGKTTTVIQYAKSRDPKSKILYLAFNKSVKNEAIQKFQAQGLNNVKVETAHSLAFRNVVYGSTYKLKNNGYNTYEIANLLGLKAEGEKHSEYIVANHINKFITYFCNSEKEKVNELDYLEVVKDPKARKFVKSFYPYIEKQTRILLAKMNSAEIEIIHDFYLKKFQLSQLQLGYDYILFDEGQDASPAMLSLFLNQQATKVIVGDTHQQIYGWRYATNSLEKTDFTSFSLSKSFRFGEAIAKLSSEVIAWKEHLYQKKSSLQIEGLAKEIKPKNKAFIARTNLGLLVKAIKFTSTNKNKKAKIYFEGNIHSYTFAEEGASLYDVLNLHNGKKHLIRDPLIKLMRSTDELSQYVKKTDEKQLSMMIEIVQQYGNKLPAIINSIKEQHIDHNDKSEADFIFTTVHRSKGMEYDVVELADDFITEDSLEYALHQEQEHVDKNKLNEEINLLYVAITRTKHELYIPMKLLPASHEKSPLIHVLITKEEAEKLKAERKKGNTTMEKRREKNKKAYRPWTAELDHELANLHAEGLSIDELMGHFERTKGAIVSRLKKLHIVDQ